ncbi:MAG: hypothetical protein WC989_05135 [Micavibrio sp.]
MNKKDAKVTGFRFLLGASGMLVVVLTGELPINSSVYTLRATPNEIVFRAGQEEIARFAFSNKDVFNELAKLSTIGAVECSEGGVFPGELTNLLYVETMRGAA